MQEVDVTIVGGGPTGLFTAFLLQHQGTSVCVLDEKPSTLDLGRADALNARTQQYFEVAGILAELLPNGLKCNTSSTWSEGEFKSRQNTWWVSIEHALHKNFLMIGQPIVEKVMADRLQGAVRHNEKVKTIVEGDDFVEVTTESGYQVRSKYAVGSDGARSFVRNALGIQFTGTKPEMLWAVLDTYIETDFPVCPEIITFELEGQSRVAWIPRERGLSRFYVLLKGEVTQALAEESIKQHLAPHKVDFLKTEWYSTFYVKERIADTFISKEGSGRIFLAGDAAHVHSVNGGQGLNTGISDAFGLAWRLALASHPEGLAPGAVDKILRSYDIERRNTARQVIDVAATLVRDTVHTAKQYVSTIQKNAGFITGMGVSYDDLGSPLIQSSDHSIWRAGERCPDVIISSKSASDSTRLYTEVSYGKFLVLSIGQALDSSSYGPGVASYKILPTTSSDTASQKTEALNGYKLGLSKEFEADWVNPDDAFTVVVRPDMYIGFVGADEADCKAYLDGVFAASI